MNPANELLEKARGFTTSRVILTAAEFDLFSRLHAEPGTAAELAEGIDADTRALTRILDCLVTFDLLRKEDGVYRPTEKGAYLASDHPQSVLPMVLHLGHMWRNWSHLTETVRRGTNPHRQAAAGERDRLVNFIGAMHVVGREASKEIATSYDASPFRRLLDIGGGSGTYTIAFLERNPELRAVLFDMPDVMPLAEARLREEGWLDRVTLAPGDFYVDPLPGGCDLALLSAIIHQNGPDENLALYRKVHEALEPGGKILVRDHFMEEQRTSPPAGAQFAINMLVGTPRGDTYTFAETREALGKAGFEDVRLLRRGERMDALVEARKPA
jgi:SAM-dependent methyltransferase